MADVVSSEPIGKVAVTEAGTNFLDPLIADPKDAASAHRKRKSANVEKTVHPADKEEEVERGWTVLREGKRAARSKILP
jgi:hypothetical protein